MRKWHIAQILLQSFIRDKLVTLLFAESESMRVSYELFSQMLYDALSRLSIYTKKIRYQR